MGVIENVMGRKQTKPKKHFVEESTQYFYVMRESGSSAPPHTLARCEYKPHADMIVDALNVYIPKLRIRDGSGSK
jgi:hypothetical protein